METREEYGITIATNHAKNVALFLFVLFGENNILSEKVSDSTGTDSILVERNVTNYQPSCQSGYDWNEYVQN